MSYKTIIYEYIRLTPAIPLYTNLLSKNVRSNAGRGGVKTTLMGLSLLHNIVINPFSSDQ